MTVKGFVHRVSDLNGQIEQQPSLHKLFERNMRPWQSIDEMCGS